MSAAAKVSVAYVHPDELSANFHQSFVGMLMHDAGGNRYLMHPDGHIDIRCGTDGLIDARNDAIKEFLNGKGEWLLWIDSDMGFSPNSLDVLMAAADPKERPIVGGLCFVSKNTAQDGLGGYATAARPTIFRWVEDDGIKAFRGLSYYPINSLVRCDATGSALILIHRSVFEKIRDEYGETWYNKARGTDGSLLGEDISLCLRAGALGIPIHVHTGVKTNHHKPYWVSEIHFWKSYDVPPATERTAVLVPTMDRPENIERFMTSLRATTALATAYAILHRDDPSVDAWRAAGAEIIVGDCRTFMEKVNYGYRLTHEPWLFLTGDDVRFHPGWLDHAQFVAKSERKSVVGTNDMANPRVMNGEHAVHWLISREYVNQVGASWDGPGIIAHEGYRYWYSDDEIVTAAKQRNEWAMALGSLVEHFHPAFGTAPDHKTYQVGRPHTEADRKLFEKRLRRSLRPEVAHAS